MRIVDKVQFALGIFDIIVGICLVIYCILLNRTNKIVCAFLPFVLGISALLRGIETNGKRKRKEERIKAQARLIGWKGGDTDDRSNQNVR